MYIPPFTISAEAINLIAEISAQTERYAIRLEQEEGLRLRKANRIKTIHSSLAIEGNRQGEELKNVGESDGNNVGRNVGVNVGRNEQKILTLIDNSPRVSMKDMAEVIGTSLRQCERIVAQMKADGLIRRVGATKNGHWEIIK